MDKGSSKLNWKCINIIDYNQMKFISDKRIGNSENYVNQVWLK